MADERNQVEKRSPNWRVDPSPDGRGAPPEKPPMLPFSLRRFAVILGVLLLANYLFVAIFAPVEERDTIPYTPGFVTQIERGNVKEISATGDTVQGEFENEVEGNDLFETEVPTFANNEELSRLLQANDVLVNAEPPHSHTRCMTMKVGPKGQVVIPKPIRDRLGLRPGDRVRVEQEGSGVRLSRAVTVDELVGSLPPSDVNPLDALMEERRRDRAREDSRS